MSSCFFRNLFACIAAFVSLRRKNLAAFGKRENRGLLVFRSAAGYAGMIALFYASGHAAQGDVAIINKMSPFVVTVLACLFLKEKFTAYQGVALGLAFGGALLVSNPTFQSHWFPVAVAMLAGCSGNTTSGSSSTGETGTASESSTAGETTGTEKNKLAFFLPMTGDQMQYGESLSRGAELALKQYNEKNGTDYVIEIMDDKGDPKEAVNVANLIVSDPTVIAGMGSFSSSCAMAAAPVFEEADLLLFSPNASHTDFPAMGENMFSAVMSQKYEGAEFADALIEMFGAQNVAILYQNTDHGVIATDVFTKQYEAGGGKVIMSETFIPGQTKDFSPVLSRIKEQDPDLFYVNASYNDCAQIFMQAKALNMDCQLVGPGMLLTEEFLDVVGNKIDGTIVMSSVPAFLPSVLESGELDAASKNFVDSYTAEYNEVPDGFAASAFDAVNIVLDAVAKVGTDTPALREELKTLRDYPGVSGYNMSFNEQKEMVKGIYLFEIQDGQFVRVK